MTLEHVLQKKGHTTVGHFRDWAERFAAFEGVAHQTYKRRGICQHVEGTMRGRVLAGRYNGDIARMIMDYNEDIPDDPDAFDEHLRARYTVVADAHAFQTKFESARSPGTLARHDALAAARISAEYLSVLERELGMYERQVQERKAHH